MLERGRKLEGISLNRKNTQVKRWIESLVGRWSEARSGWAGNTRRSGRPPSQGPATTIWSVGPGLVAGAPPDDQGTGKDDQGEWKEEGGKGRGRYGPTGGRTLVPTITAFAKERTTKDGEGDGRVDPKPGNSFSRV